MTIKEVRHLTTDFNLEFRDVDGGTRPIIEGYALKFNRQSELLGDWFTETIDAEALRNTDMSDVVALFNHNDDKPLGRAGVNLELEVDNIGLRFVVQPPQTSYAADVIENMRSGIIKQCSFAMSDIESEWSESEKEGIYSRKITNIGKIWDVSIVTSPAYKDTEAVIGARSKEKVEKLLFHDTRKDAIRKKIIESSLY